MCTHKSQTVIVLKQKLYVHPNLAIFTRITCLNFKNDHDCRHIPNAINIDTVIFLEMTKGMVNFN